jgi:hypothetical protein
MSLLSLPPHIHSTSPPLHDEEMRQVEEYLADEQAIDAAEHARLLEYLLASRARQEALPSESEALGGYLADAAAPAPPPDPIAALAENLRLLAVPEEDEEELDTHTCGDSECQGEHVHADEGDYYGISPSYSPNHGEFNYYEQPYIPATPPYD